MTSERERDVDRERDRFLALLADAEKRPEPMRFWWRDDDAEEATPQFDRLLSLSGRHHVPVALAVVPKRATQAMAERIAAMPLASVLQHGWRHRNHAPPDEKKMELGAHRPAETVLDELERGFDRLRAGFPDKFLPILVPPWNRISDEVCRARRTVGLIGVSTFGPVPKDAPHWVNVHLDIIDWGKREPIARAAAYAILSRELERRLDGDDEPLGIMTHHLVHHEANWTFLDELFGAIANHPAVTWPPVAELFDVAAPVPQSEPSRP